MFQHHETRDPQTFGVAIAASILFHVLLVTGAANLTMPVPTDRVLGQAPPGGSIGVQVVAVAELEGDEER